MEELFYEFRPWVFLTVGVYAIANAVGARTPGLWLISGFLFVTVAGLIFWLRYKNRR